MNKLLRESGKDYNGKNCGRDITVGRKKNLSLLAEGAMSLSKEDLKALKSLHSKKKLKSIISSLYNSEGESENCDVNTMKIYSEDGKVLTLIDDNTT